MPRDARVDAYIEAQADFARPILTHLREAVHAACPECVEAIKWSMPAFLHRGKQLAGMAAFKAHATFGLWRGSELVESKPGQANAMGQFGRLTSLDDLPPPPELEALIKQAMALADAGAKPVRNKNVKEPLDPPPDLLDALAADSAASAVFEGFPPGCRREYFEWVLDAKRPETRARRIAQAVTWIAEGKKRNWKYEKC
ncbi:MAG TPA: YdeI/OmpD-associated family protein [Allosphingosinicella sp.]|jgi:uncharacterized protein YdeI (YjbR/CyaY-like superfamily)|uniref:YdeI/OmpD-associated family protein n=1 Tax=Allosphingosinicella sp. TaxID=2823234 RepID=UPI002F2A06F6